MTLTTLQKIQVWRKGCSCMVNDDPYTCRDCTVALINEIEVGEKQMEEARMVYDPRRPMVCVDFDGVLHSYTSGWKSVDVIPDPPLPGAIQWLWSLIQADFNVQILSARCNEPSGIRAMKQWLIDNGLGVACCAKLTFMPGKPKAHIIIDDRAWRFAGIFPHTQEIRDFKPWRINQ